MPRNPCICGGETFILTTDDIAGDLERVSVTLKRLPRVVKGGDILFLNDGLIQLQVIEVRGSDVICTVEVGGELRSRKGLNLPGIDLGESAFTPRDYECMKFALEKAVEAMDCDAVLVPSASGATARNMTRFRLPAWIYAISPDNKTCQDLLFSYGVHPILHHEQPGDWTEYARKLAEEYAVQGDCVILTEGPSPDHPQANYRMEIITLQP